MVKLGVFSRWVDTLAPPRKDWRWFEASAHFPMFEEPEAFHDYLVEVVKTTAD